MGAWRRGAVLTVAATDHGMGIWLATLCDDPNARYEGWLQVQPEIAREGLAVALAAIVGNLPIAVQMADRSAMEPSWRAITVQAHLVR